MMGDPVMVRQALWNIERSVVEVFRDCRIRKRMD
jgi:hypothetical protein